MSHEMRKDAQVMTTPVIHHFDGLIFLAVSGGALDNNLSSH